MIFSSQTQTLTLGGENDLFVICTNPYKNVAVYKPGDHKVDRIYSRPPRQDSTDAEGVVFKNNEQGVARVRVDDELCYTHPNLPEFFQTPFSFMRRGQVVLEVFDTQQMRDFIDEHHSTLASLGLAAIDQPLPPAS